MAVQTTIVEHPVCVDALTSIRDTNTPDALFRQNLGRIGSLNVATAAAIGIYELRRMEWAG